MKKKIIYVTSRFPFDNWETWAFHEIESLLESNIEVTIIPRSSNGKLLGEKALNIFKYTISTGYINLNIIINFFIYIFIKPQRIIKYLNWIIKHSNSILDLIKALTIFPKSLYLGSFLKNKGYKHIHAYSTTSVSVVAYILSQELHIPWSITFHSSWHLDAKHMRSTKLQLKSVLFARSISDLVKNDIVQFMGDDFFDKIKTIHIGIKCGNYKKSKISNISEIRIVSVGYLLPHKGLDISLIAASLLIKRGFTNFRWTIYGDGPLLSELLRQTKKLNLGDNIIFAGRIDNKQLMKEYKDMNFDLLIQNSVNRFGVSEGIPVSIMEAMAYGIPVIASDCGGTKELIDGKSGILIPQNDPLKLSSEIINITSNYDLLNKISENGRQKVINQFNSKLTAKELIKAFNL
jgi:colanic acid/amylovoran biosynthesis glycosyltransferase